MQVMPPQHPQKKCYYLSLDIKKKKNKEHKKNREREMFLFTSFYLQQLMGVFVQDLVLMNHSHCPLGFSLSLFCRISSLWFL